MYYSVTFTLSLLVFDLPLASVTIILNTCPSEDVVAPIGDMNSKKLPTGNAYSLSSVVGNTIPIFVKISAKAALSFFTVIKSKSPNHIPSTIVEKESLPAAICTLTLVKLASDFITAFAVLARAASAGSV